MMLQNPSLFDLCFRSQPLVHSLITALLFNTFIASNVVSAYPIATMGSYPDGEQIAITSASPLPNPIKDGKFVHNNTIAPAEQRVFALFNNTGKTAIVTGAGAGIGLGVAQALAESGANVAIWYHGNADAILRAKEIEKQYKVKCELIPLSRPSLPLDAGRMLICSQAKRMLLM